MQFPPSDSDSEFLRIDRYRVFVHPDGRRWKCRVKGNDVDLVIILAPGVDPVERKRTFTTSEQAKADLQGLIGEQLAEGFKETTFDCLIFVRDSEREWKRAGQPTETTLPTILRLLSHEDFRIVEKAGRLLAEYAESDACFDALWSVRERSGAFLGPAAHLAGREAIDGLAWALLRAAEVRRDPVMRPYLEWMASSQRFAGPGYKKRIADALSGLRATEQG